MINEAATNFFDSSSASKPPPAWLSDAVIRIWDLPKAARIKPISVSENAVFRVDTSGGPAVLRVHRPDYVSDRRVIEAELAWITAIRRDTTVKTPGILKTAGGDTIGTLISQAGEQLWAEMFEFVDGAAMESLALDTTSFRAIGDIAARLHNHAEQWAGRSTFSRFDWGLRTLSGPSKIWGNWREIAMPEIVRKTLVACETRACSALEALLRRDATTWGPIHSDLRRANFIVDDERIWVLDFDDAGTGWYLYDCAAAFDYVDDPLDVRMGMHSWVEGYSRHRAFSDIAAEATSHFLMLRRLMLLGWAHSRRSHTDDQAWLAGRLAAAESEADAYLRSPNWTHE